MNNINTAMDLLWERFSEGSVVWMIVFSLLVILALIYTLRAIYIYKKRAVDSFNFILFSVPMLIWGLLIIAGPVFGFNNGEGTFGDVAIKCAVYLIPPLLMLHIWSQVSYRPITYKIRIIWLVLPAILTFMNIMKVAAPDMDFGTIPVWEEQISVVAILANVFFVIVSIKSYLLCFNVFYQMPPHMRRSTHHMLIAISVIVAAQGISGYIGVAQHLVYLLLAVAYMIALYTLFSSFFIANAANVIVTSREFVFASLSTLVITVSLKGNILDWNKKGKDNGLVMPNPRFKEPYEHYRKRVLETCNGTVSPHDENIVNLLGEESESNFLLTWHEIGFKGNKFGYLVEIADVTNIYTKLRYIESIAYYDNLTSLHNRNAYMERVMQLDKAESMPLLIVIGDVNNLKNINDAYGHLAGDQLLLAVTQAVKDNTPEGAFVARVGGDEIVMLLPRAREEQADTFVDGVTRSLNSLRHPEIGSPSVSWGYSIMHDAAEDYNNVFRAADAIMYEAKRKSREKSISGIVPHEGIRHDVIGHGAGGHSDVEWEVSRHKFTEQGEPGK